MKKITLFILLLISSIGFSQNAPISFETGQFGSTWTFASFENGTGAGYSKVANPFPGGINSSATVGKFIAGTSPVAAPYAGFESAHASGVNGIGTFTLSASNSIIKIMVYKTVISDVGIKFAIANNGAQPEIKVPNTKINEWEELTFDFSGKIGFVETINIDQIIFFLDYNARTTETTSYFDNVTFSAKSTPIVSGATLPLNFESGSYAFIDFDGGAATKIANPHVTGINTSANVAQMVKGAGQPWAGSKIKMASPVDFSTKKLFKVKVWSAVAGKKLLLKFEKSDGTGGFEKESTGVTAANTWEELSFDFTGVAGVTNLDDTMVFIFDLGTAGDGSANSTYLFDDITQSAVSGVGTPATMGPNAPVTFETGEQGSTWTFTNFENGTDLSVGYEKVANPNTSGLNTSATVGKFIAKVAGATWAGCQSNGIGKFTLDPTNSTVKIMVYKTVISDVALKFAIAGGGSLGEIKVPNTKVNEWEELTFDFYNQIGKLESTDIVTMMISPDYRVRTTDDVSYFDNITFSKTSVAPPVLVCDEVLTEAQQGTFDIGYKTSFVTTGTDVLVTFELLDAKDGTVAYLWKESPFGETAMTNVSGRKFTYNLTGQKVGNIITYACKFGYAGGQSVTKYIKYEVGSSCTTTPTTGTGPILPLDFESSSYAFVNFDGGAVTKIANPHSTGINTSANVAQMVKGAGQPWGGSKIKMAAPVDFSTKKLFKVKVWSPVAGKKLLLKFEKSDGTGGFEKESNGFTAANTWEELSFDFTGVAGVTNLDDNLVFIFDLGTMGDGSANSTYLFDDITQSAVSGSTITGATLPLNFESASYAFVDFDGGVATKIVNPHLSGINTSANVAQMVKGAGQPWAGSKIKMAAPVDFSTKKLFKVKIWSPVAGKKLLLKFEKSDGTGGFEKESTGVTAANTWEELSFDFTGVAGVTNLDDTMVFIFDLGTMGDGSANSTYLFDDITQSAVSGGGSSKTQMNLPVSFDDATVDYGLIGFGGADVSSVVVDPTSSTNKVAKVVKSATAELWAGTTISAAAGLGFSGVIPFTTSTTKMSVRVWSPNAGIKVRLKLEEHGDNTHTVETETTVTTASGWQTLEFNFANQAAGTAALNLAFKYDKASIFFNFGTTGAIAGEKTYYFDDVVFGASLGTTKFETSKVRMYPNPSTSYMTIEANSMIERVAVYNLLGQEVLVKIPKSNSTILQTSELQKGVYIVKTEIDGKVNVAKIIKE
jgi:hypothetical protein